MDRAPTVPQEPDDSRHPRLHRSRAENWEQEWDRRSDQKAREADFASGFLPKPPSADPPSEPPPVVGPPAV